MIRVNVEGEGDPAEVAKAAIESLHTLIDYEGKAMFDVIVENHVGISCNGAWLAAVMKAMNTPHCGTFADFGNFALTEPSLPQMILPDGCKQNASKSMTATKELRN